MTVVIKKHMNRLPIAPIAAVLAALIAFALVMASPDWLLNKIVLKSGLTKLLAAAAPPLGQKATLMLAAAAATGAALVTLIAMIPLSRRLNNRRSRPLVSEPVGPLSENVAVAKDVSIQDREQSLQTSLPTPSVGFRRPPIFAERELGAPFMADDSIALSPQPQAAAVAEDDVPFFTAPSQAIDSHDVQSFSPAEYKVPEAIAQIDDALDLELSQIADIPEEVDAEVAPATAYLPVQPVFASESYEPSQPEISVAPATTNSDYDWTVNVPLPSNDGYDVYDKYTVQEVVAPLADVSPVVQPELVVAPVPVTPEAQPEPAPLAKVASAAAPAEISISELLERFETGLRRRQLQNLVASSTLTGAGSSAAAADAALGQALDTLERLAATAR